MNRTYPIKKTSCVPFSRPQEQGLPARQVGTEWRLLKMAIQEWLSTAAPAGQARKEAQLALAGKYKDDPDLMPICEEAYRQRGRRMLEDE